MMLDQAAAALTLWRSRKWDTADIARVLDGGGNRAVSEADVVRVIDIARAVECGPDLRVVKEPAE